MTKKSEDKKVGASIPLKYITYRASVNGAFARVKCVQEFENDAENPVEAVYVFPMPDESSVTACTMKIGQRKVEAELKKREEARKEYDDAVAAGHHASLLEQERPNIFTMNVGGIEPGEKISVEVDYIQRVPWQAGGGRFSIPLVVAPRFIPGVPTGKQAGGFSPDTDEVPDVSRITPVVAKEGVSYNADISVAFSPGFRCKLSSPSHSTLVPEQTLAKADTVELKTGNILTDRDFIFVYTSLSKVPEVAVHAGEFQKENFLLANILPPGDVAPVGSDIVFLLDCSGSMDGAKIEGLKVIAKKIVNNLKKQNVNHKVGIVPFDNAPWPKHPLGDINEATESFINGLHARGGTMLGLGLQGAEQLLSGSKRPKVILMVTDGETESGVNWYGNGIRLVAVGIDTAVNDTQIKELTKRNFGTAEFVYPGEDYAAVANRLAGYLSGPVLRDVEVKAEGDVVGVSDVFKGRPATIAVRFSKKAGKVKISGKDPDDKKCSWEVGSEEARECDFIAQIWAREFIREKQDEKKQTEVSLKYGVICQHTSFVAVSLKEVPGKKPERIEIPVNLPVGWNFESVFGTPHQIMALSAGFKGSRGFALQSLGASINSIKLCESADVSLDSFAGGVPKMRRIKSGIGKIKKSIGAIGKFPRRPIPSVPKIPTLPKRPQIPTPQVPVPPIPASVTSKRFVLDAKDIVDRAIGILVALGAGKRNEAEKAFKQLEKELTLQKIKKLSDEKKAMLKYFLRRIAWYGFSVDEKIIAKLTWKKETSETKVWAYLALREEGSAPVKKSAVPSGETSEYISWKFGQGEKPVSGDWAVVP